MDTPPTSSLKIIKWLYKSLFATAIATACFGSSLHADTFNDSLAPSNSRASGTQLNGSAIPDTNDKRWQASGNVILTDAIGGVATNENTDVFFARTPLPNINNSLEITAQLRPGDATTPAAWSAVGFGANPQPFKFTWDDGVFVLLTPAGAYQIIANYKSGQRDTINLGSGTLPNYSNQEFVTIRIRYDVADNRVSAWIDGKQVARSSLDNRGFKPSLTVGGFSGFGQKSRTLGVRNLSVTTD